MATGKRIGFAVVGLGSISQTAVLPALTRTKKAKLAAVVSGGKKKAEKFAQDFPAVQPYTYAEFSQCLENPAVDAIYIATPQGEHEKYTVAAAKAGKHVISEKPLAATVQQARNMVNACRRNKVLLMTAYRKYFEPASLMLKKMIADGDLGRIDIVHALFTELHTFGDNSPAWLFSQTLAGGGPLTDLGVYCINTSRWLIDEDPISATGISWARDKRRYKEVEEGVAFRLDFKSGIVLQGTTAYSAGFSSFLHVHGEKGWAEMAPAFAFEEERRMSGKIGGKWFAKEFKPVDEFALEIDAFADCIREGREPEPSGEQGLRDVVIIDAIYRAVKQRKPVAIRY